MVRSVVVACFLLVHQSLGGYQLTYSAPEDQGLSSGGIAKISAWSAKYVEEGKLAGMVTLVARRGDIVHFEAVGQRGSGDPVPRSPPVEHPEVADGPVEGPPPHRATRTARR